MVIVISAGILMVVLSLAYVWHLCANAPEGCEDAGGFHYTNESEIPVKSAGQNRPETLKSHDDHEPVAA